MGTVWVQGAPSGPVQRGRLLELGRAPNYVHSCFIISTKFQDRQEQARRRGQGRQQVTARSCCAQGAEKWHGSSRSCGLQPPSPCSEMPARKKIKWTKVSGSTLKFSSLQLTVPPRSLVQQLMQGMSSGQGLSGRVLGGCEAGAEVGDIPSMGYPVPGSPVKRQQSMLSSAESQWRNPIPCWGTTQHPHPSAPQRGQSQVRLSQPLSRNTAPWGRGAGRPSP